MTYDGRVALVTGAGSGIGRTTCLQLAEEGYSVVCTDQPGRGHLLSRLIAAIEEKGGIAFAQDLDVQSTESIRFAFDEVFNRFGQLNVLVNNAGVQIMKPAVEIEEAEFDRVLEINLKGPFFCCQEAYSLMSAGGAIVNVASQHGVVANTNRAPYCASKAGLINLTRALALEWASAGIRVNAVSPTFVLTETNADLLNSAAIAPQIAQNLPLGRAATTEEVSYAICFLVSDKASSITGHNLLVDGGWTAR